jgi:hypothetical protein
MVSIRNFFESLGQAAEFVTHNREFKIARASYDMVTYLALERKRQYLSMALELAPRVCQLLITNIVPLRFIQKILRELLNVGLWLVLLYIIIPFSLMNATF